MAKKTKETSKKTKDEKFNFDEEIVIGLKRIDDKKEEPSKKKKKSKSTEKNVLKQDNAKKQTQSIKVKRKPKQKKLTKEQEIAKKKRMAIFRIVKWTTLFFIVIGGIIYTLLSPIFNIKTIDVVGNSKISMDEIISLSKIELETNMFQYHKQEISSNIKENAYIESVQIKRKIPDTIEIIVEEREAKFMIQFANAYAYINNQGYILEISDKKENLPILIGIQTIQEEMHIGNRLCIEDLKKLSDVLKIMESATSNGIYDIITKIDITDGQDYILTLEKEKKIVHLGDTSNLSTKMLWLIKFNELEKGNQGEIMLNMNLNDEKNKPYFRKEV